MTSQRARGHVSVKPASYTALENYARRHNLTIKRVVERLIIAALPAPPPQRQPKPETRAAWRTLILSVLSDWATIGWLRERLPPAMSKFIPELLSSLEQDKLIECHRGRYPQWRCRRTS